MSNSELSAWSGVVTSGERRAAGFTQIDRVRDAFVKAFGINPFPGTLNLTVDAPTRSEIDSRLDEIVQAPGDDRCPARGLHVTLMAPGHDRPFPAAIIRPDVDGYPCDKLEILASVNLRDTLALEDGHAISVTAAPQLAVDAAIFDLDGTLVNSLDAYFQVARVAARSRGRDVTRDFVRGTLDANNHAFWELVFTEDEPDRAASISAVKLTARQAWPDIQRDFVTHIVGIDAMLQTLVDRGIRIGVVTAGSGTTVTPLEVSGSHSLIETMVTREHVDNPKPDPQGLQRAMRELSVSPERTVYVGDSRVDIQTAHAAGAHAVGVLTGAGSPESLAAERPSRVMATLDELPDLIRQK